MESFQWILWGQYRYPMTRYTRRRWETKGGEREAGEKKERNEKTRLSDPGWRERRGGAR
jgi:hypothetical protein